MIYWIIGKFYAKISRHKKTYQEIKKLSAFKPFRDRRTDSVAYRGPISFLSLLDENGRSLWDIGVLYSIKRDALLVHWIKRRVVRKKIMVLTQEMRKLYAFRAIFERDRHCGF